MTILTASIELDDDEIAELVTIGRYYGMSLDEVLRDALDTGLSVRRGMYQADTTPPGETDDDIIPF